LLDRLAAGSGAADLGGIASWDAASDRVTLVPPDWLPSVDGLRADRRWIDNRLYFDRGGMANLQTKRGCHYKCTYCAYPVIEGRGMRLRGPASIAASVRSMVDDLGLQQLFIVDRMFNAPGGYAERVCV